MPHRYKNKKVSVVGLGYIGLPTAAAFASSGVRVVGVDVNEKAVSIINQGRIHIVEPELDMIVKAAVTNGYLKATTEPEPADAFLIAVPTPFKGDHEPDLAFVEAAARSIAPVLKPGALVILESTSPVGTTEKLCAWLAEARPDLSFPDKAGDASDIRIAYCPERVLPGRVMHELVENDRVIGGMTRACSEAAVALYQIFVRGECIVTNSRTAEMCKLTENAFRDVNIAFANELSIICDKIGVNVWELIKLANRHPRVNILQPGCGVGGHCIAVDPWFIVDRTPAEARIIRAAREVNDSKPDWVVARVRQAVGEYLLANPDKTAKEVRLACLGLAFKPDIDDLRESPAMEVAKQLQAALASDLMLVEPNIEALPPGLSGGALVTLPEALESADVVVVLVAHREFIESRASLKARAFVVDAVGVLER